MKRIEFYKPQKSGNGSCLTLNVTSGIDEKKDGFYVGILKQASWDAASGNGSFKENVNNPEKHKKVKLTELELCSILDVIENGKAKKFSTVHVNGEKKTPIFFEPYIREEVHVGYVLKIDGLSIALNAAESVKVREYIKAALFTYFTTEYRNNAE